ncbi:sugar ABC transporter ATP-binding protein [Sansalvadorimonas sp. 2012CJ34-2]|uniref:Sugar ABC transporter ATP-binding protein n=1 Tax=Parendozoicomonas callyspongiae TaxID=2942213 RepID=A0ABT0PI00_9GAMM|nr:sugar ABC transporter ATP-binding protein [Sansalvadorimonas sp. 2012CJ34-2]MCL6270990.1 sugar ABC transporter ATP-binding protein [Sansalvadorimonas sp. 2012CJ34-2]
MRNIVKSFGATRALKGVDFTVTDAEVHGLLGENGAGKSTLMNILGGTYNQNSGDIIIDGKDCSTLDTNTSFSLGIRFIHQELNLVNDLMAYENLFLGREKTSQYGRLDKLAMIQASTAVFKRMNVDIDPLTEVRDLDTSQKQLVEIARALLFDCKLIIMDEPTTALTNKEISNLFDIIRSLKNEGVSVIYISHKMPELFEICDSYTVFRDGCFIQSGAIKDIDEHIATELLVGRKIDSDEVVKPANTNSSVMDINALSCKPYFRDVSFSLKKGEVLAITGLFGDGRGELAECLFGARHTTDGEILINGKVSKHRRIKDAIDASIAMIPRNRKERSIIPDMSIQDNLSMASFSNNGNSLFVRKPQERERFSRCQKNMNIKSGHPDNLITSLSGGNQQKVIFSRWLELDSDILILDNPTQGIDVGAKFQIYHLINQLSEQSKSCILFSSEFPEIYQVADRCLVMYMGQVNTILSREELTEMNVMYYATGSNLEVKNAINQ